MWKDCIICRDLEPKKPAPRAVVPKPKKEKKVETPKKVESPKGESPKIESPKIESPKIESPKEEQKEPPKLSALEALEQAALNNENDDDIDLCFCVSLQT